MAGQAGQYDPSAADQTAELRRLTGIEQSQARVQFLRGLLGTELEDGPDAARRCRCHLPVRPQARRHTLAAAAVEEPEATRFPILSTSAIYGGSNSASDVDLDGVEFCEVPWLLGANDEASIPRPLRRAQVVSMKTASGLSRPAVRLRHRRHRLLPHLEWLERNTGRPVIVSPVRSAAP